MRYAILADIHGNLDALQVVLEDCKQQKCTHYVCLGDVVGYNAQPAECLKIVREMNIPSDEVRIRLLNDHGVCVAHGAAYGKMGEGTLRVSFASGGEALAKGLARLSEGLAKIGA